MLITHETLCIGCLFVSPKQFGLSLLYLLHISRPHQYICARSWLMGRSWETSAIETTGEAEDWSLRASCIRLLPELPLGTEDER